MTEAIAVALSGGVRTVTLARPERKNALTNAMYGQLAQAIGSADDDPAVRVILLQAEGDSFSAGNDLGEFAEQAAGRGPPERLVIQFLKSLVHAQVPIVAAVQGNAVGVATTLLLHCDFVILAEDARLSTPFINLALVPEAGSTLLLPNRIGHVRAFEMLALGKPVPAAQALAWGLANRVVPNERLRAEARGIADELATKPRGSLLASKRLMRDSQQLATRIDQELQIFSERLRGPEAREAFQAFREKRAPDFTRIDPAAASSQSKP